LFEALNEVLPRSGLSRSLAIFLVAIIFLTLIFSGFFLQLKSSTKPEVFVGVMAGFGSVDEIVKFVDEIDDYVNLIIISELNITTNATSLYEVFDYLFARGLYFMPFMTLFDYLDVPNFFQVAKERWDDHMIGVYTFDEPGGKQIDLVEHRPVDEAQNYSDAASQYMQVVAQEGLVTFADKYNQVETFTIFTSDYGLFWFDYSACYNVVLTQFGWNQSSQLNVALCRGAATGHNSDWGAIITWTFNQPPYLESPEKLYDDMVLAYDNGAKYIVVFNFPTNVTEYGVLTEDHLESMQRFWEYQKDTIQPEKVAEVAYVLPKDYGYGFRGSDDKIWGLWGPDDLSPKVWNDVTGLLEVYGSKLDIIYEPATPEIRQHYKTLVFWNNTRIQNN